MKKSKQAYSGKYFEKKNGVMLRTILITNNFNINNQWLFLIIILPLYQTPQKSIKYSLEHFSDYLSNESSRAIYW